MYYSTGPWETDVWMNKQMALEGRRAGRLLEWYPHCLLIVVLKPIQPTGLFFESLLLTPS